MRRSIFNPRIVLTSVFAAITLISIEWAYVERPRLEAGFGGIGDTVAIDRSRYPETNVRSVQFQDALEKRLTSPELLDTLRSRDVHGGGLYPDGTAVVIRRAPPLSVNARPLVAEVAAIEEAYERDALAFVVSESGQADRYVMYLYPRSYGVHKSPNSWIRWLQRWLPGMSDPARIEAEAEAVNRDMKDEINRLIRAAIDDSARSK